jgi:UDP-N-acetylmuramate-alanine ligase
VITIEGEDDLAAAVAPYVKPGAAIIGTGAGSITGWMNNLPQILAKKLEGLL